LTGPDGWPSLSQIKRGRTAVTESDLDQRDQSSILRYQTLLEVSGSIALHRELPALFHDLAQKLPHVVPLDVISLYLHDPAKNVMRMHTIEASFAVSVPRETPVEESPVGWVWQTQQPLVLTDDADETRFSALLRQMKEHRFKTVCILPLTTAQRRVGVIGFGSRLSRETYALADLDFLMQVSKQVALAVDNALLYGEINDLFEGFIAASVKAIEARHPPTFGHSERVATLTCRLAEVVDHADTGPYAGLTFDADQLREIRYAALLHDFGKVGVREHVLVKAEKLQPGDLALLKARFDFIKCRLHQENLEHKLAISEGLGAQERKMLFSPLDADLQRRLAEVDEMLAFVLAYNRPTEEGREDLARLKGIAEKMYESFAGPQPYLTEQELVSLSIPKGTLTMVERREIESHVAHTYRFLATIPWSSNLRRVPDIAHAHHEKLDGTGYPCALSSAGIPIPSRMMTICDIYDALTAQDRPYKKRFPSVEALNILGQDAKAGKIDADLLQLFIEARVYKDTR